MNDIIIIYWRDCEVTWIPNTKDSVKFLAKFLESIDYFIIAEPSKQFIEENKLTTTNNQQSKGG
jgi:hypothetical protein